jgi:hypothetical protein
MIIVTIGRVATRIFIYSWNSNSMQSFYQKKYFEKDYHKVLISNDATFSRKQNYGLSEHNRLFVSVMPLSRSGFPVPLVGCTSSSAKIVSTFLRSALLPDL